MQELKSEGSIYKIEKFGGQGQTARVFRAIRHDSRGHSQQTVALKILKNEKSIPWLRREFEALTRVDSPYCVRVLGWENLPEGSALVLEWVDGVTLFDLVRDWSFDSEPISELIDEIVAQVQEGLRALERCGLHHGDLSPVNILIDINGAVRIVDFGTIQPEAGVIHGTPGYLAPELWAGSIPNLKADFFSLGLIEYDLRTSFVRLRSQGAVQAEDMKECVTRLAVTQESPLLRLDPQRRETRPLIPSAGRRDQLAESVRRYLQRRKSTLIRTEIQASPANRESAPHRRITASVITLLVIAITAVVPVRAQAPLLRVSELRTACLRIRSQLWIGLSIDGSDVGFAPIELTNLRPGEHELLWRSHRQMGRKRVFLQPHRCTHLSEADFGIQRQPRKH